MKSKFEVAIWRRRREFGGPWGFFYEVYNDQTDECIAFGWRESEQRAKADGQRIADEKNTATALAS